MLNGAGSIVAESGAAIVGGHSIENKEPIFGMSVTGQVNPNCIWKNKGPWGCIDTNKTYWNRYHE